MPDKAKQQGKLFDELPRLENEKILLRPLEMRDAGPLDAMRKSAAVYRYLPTFLFEQQYKDPEDVIRLVYEDLFRNKESLILAVCLKDGRKPGQEAFCGLAEFYGFQDAIHKTCIGCRLAEPYRGQGIAAQAVGLMVDYLYGQTDIEIITASTMIENLASARVLEKNGFQKTASHVPEDWGYETPVIADKWFR